MERSPNGTMVAGFGGINPSPPSFAYGRWSVRIYD